jgi:putative endonuclease
MRIVNPTAIIGEDKACLYLKDHGYEIIGRNFRRYNGEIDVIGIDRSEKEIVLAFVEVKTRKSGQYGTGFEAITYHKLRSLIKTAELYKSLHRNLPELMRIDAISIVLAPDNNVVSVDLMKNVGSRW